MAKLKTPTPQELYRERKQREELERNSYLPPGLINHGNTCFMNSVLQGLLATRLLSDLIHFNPIPPATQNHSDTILLSRRSPQLTNGHNLAGEFDQQWVNTMPIGDAFLAVMHKAWDLQARKQREALSPRPILTELGRKYDQYLDFAQQDAHEFLRILLDVMRMEEQDIIKKRQPAVEKKRRRATLTSPNTTVPDVQAIAEEDKLMSFADMIFGGRLTSILVCQKCKHVSQTYEDFNDLSLSIKAEDYAHRKRDRLKNFAKRLTAFPSASLGMAMEMQRSSSVPPSPREREGNNLGRDEVPAIPSRRRSLDIATDQDENGTTESDHSNREQNNDKRVEFTEVEKQSGDGGKEKDKKAKKEGQDDAWAKLGRRISVSVGLTKGKDRKSRQVDRRSREFLEPNTDTRTSTDTLSSEKLKRISLSDPARPRTPENHPISETQRLGTSPVKLQDPTINPASSDPLPTRPSLEHHASSRFSIDHRARSPKPPPPTSAETAYLQKILADVGSGSSSNPFAIFKPPSLPNGHSFHTGSSGSPQGVWLGLSQFSGLEECLRMFTAVENLDGENMVGCRRCWKIQNGVYSKSSNGVDDDEDSEAEPPSAEPLNLASTAGSHKSSPSTPGSYFPTSASTPIIPYFASHDSNTSVSSLPTGITSVSDTDLPSKSVSSLESNSAPEGEVPRTPGGLPIPRISTTAPDQANDSSSVSSISLDSEIEDAPAHRLHHITDETSVSSFQGSLPVPSRHRHAETDDESSGAESDASASSSHSVNTTTSSNTQGEQPTNRLTRKPSRPKPVIMRPAYKRYLIATPPPVLVVHLKRFQQLSKTYMMSFSHGFKKLDDYITFPEYLDLTPFLAPKKEDYGLGKSKRRLKGKRDGKEKEKCMYRLYAVVVHIGNMLGGHYIAYTALPEDSPAAPSPAPTQASTKAASQMVLTSLKPKRQWAHISDTIVRLTTLEEVLQAKAYICMYERC